MKWFSASLWCVAVLLLSSCQEEGSELPQPDILATWDQGEIRVGDLDEYLLSLPPASRFPAREEAPEHWLRRKATDLFEREAVLAGADFEALEQDEAYAEGLEKRSRVVLSLEYQQRRNEPFDLSLEEAREYFEKHRDQWGSVERRSFRHLLLAVPEGASAEERKATCQRAEELRQKVLGGASFEQLVRQHSDSSNAAAGGLVGGITRRQLRGEVGKVVFGLSPGEVSQVLENRAGCQLFQVAEVVDAIEPTFEFVQDRIIQTLADQRRNAWRYQLMLEQAEKFEADLPEWIDGGTPVPQVTADDVLFDFRGEQILSRDLAEKMQGGQGAVSALRNSIEEIIFSTSMEEEAPEESAERLIPTRRAFTYEFLRRRELLDYLENQPEDTLAQFYETRKGQYLSDPRVELTLYSWPIAKGDPLKSLRRPQEFVAALRASEGNEDAVWARFANDPEIRREVIPQTGFRDLVKQRPGLSSAMVQEFEEGSVLGPYRLAKNIHVAQINVYVPPRQLSFFEVRDQVRGDFIRMEGAKMEGDWARQLAAEHNFQVIDAHLAGFGERLLDRLQQGVE